MPKERDMRNKLRHHIDYDEAREEIAKKYEADHPYFAAIDLAQRWYEKIVS